MKRMYSILALIATFTVVSFMIPNISFALDCAPSSIQSQYDYADHVFHGMLVSKQYDPANYAHTTMIFNIHESFKGIELSQVTVEFDETYDIKFVQGNEYLVFASDDEDSLEVGPCTAQFPPFETVLNIVSQLDNHDNSFGHMTRNDFHTHLSESEKTQLENISEHYAMKRQNERGILFGQLLLLGIPASAGVGIAMMWWRKTK